MWGFQLHPGRLTWNLQITRLERKMIFQTSIIVFHVNLPGCTFPSLPPSHPPSHWWVAFWSTSGRMQLQVCTCVLIVWEALKSRKVCVSFWWKTTTFGANLEPKLLWEKSGKNMMNRVLMVLYITYDIYVYIYIIYIYDTIICILMGVDQKIILRINGWNLRKEIYLRVNDGCQGIQLTNFPQHSMELLGLRQVLPTNGRWNQWIDHMGVFSKM